MIYLIIESLQKNMNNLENPQSYRETKITETKFLLHYFNKKTLTPNRNTLNSPRIKEEKFQKFLPRLIAEIEEFISEKFRLEPSKNSVV